MSATDARSGKGDHGREEDWVDFARGLGGSEDRARLAQHLETGCTRCAQTARLWRALVSVAEREAPHRPPAGALRQLQGLFALRRPTTSRRRKASGLSLLFDSLRHPEPAGVRAGPSSAQQLLYKGGRYTIKLQIEPEPGADRFSIVGQILDEQDPTRTLQDIVVLALKGSTTVDRTLTNRIGEFHLEPDTAETLQLSVGVPEIGTFTIQPPRAVEKADRDADPKALDGSARRSEARRR